MSEERPNLLEMKALHEALAGREPWKEVLAKQVAGLLVVSRKDTVVGGYTHFRLDGTYPLAAIEPDKTGYPPAIDVRHAGLPHGGAFIAWAEEGRLSLLEYYANADAVWPKYHDGSIAEFEFHRLDD